MNKIGILIVLLVVIILLELSYLVFIKGDYFGRATKVTSDIKVTERKDEDTVGRTIIYDIPLPEAFSGTGKLGGGANTLTAYIGHFDHFESIPNSQDEYLILNDTNTGEVLLKGRIDYTTISEQTNFRVENLNMTSNQKNVVENLGLANALGKEKIKKIVKAGDVLTVMIKPQDADFSQFQYDQNHIPIILRVILRRYDGSKQIQKET